MGYYIFHVRSIRCTIVVVHNKISGIIKGENNVEVWSMVSFMGTDF